MRRAHVLILICLDFDGTTRAIYVLPVAVLRERRKLTIPLTLESRLCVYRDAWGIIADCITNLDTQDLANEPHKKEALKQNAVEGQPGQHPSTARAENTSANQHEANRLLAPSAFSVHTIGEWSREEL